ncbi:MAG: regulatory protein SipA [Crocosphaera sp.]
MDQQKIAVGSKVSLVTQPPYLKTADPMPMLRPSDILQIGDEGIVMDRRPGGYWGVKFTQGTFLMESQYIAMVKT